MSCCCNSSAEIAWRETFSLSLSLTHILFFLFRLENMQQDVLPGHTNIDRDYFASETAKCTLDDWRYEMRREIQEMLVWICREVRCCYIVC